MTNSILYEIIFFVGIIVFGFFMGRFFCFSENIKKWQKIFFTKNKEKSEEEKNDNNLKIIEWIWSKIEDLLKLNWITNIKELSDSSYDEIKIILEKTWEEFRVINLRSWPYQAELAHTKQWGKLREYQDFLIWWLSKSEFNK